MMSSPRSRTGFLYVALVALAFGTSVALARGAPASAQDGDAGGGASVYAASCASCHQADGAGIPGSFPPLKGNPNVADVAYVESVVRDGLSGPIDVNGETYDSAMPAVAGLSPDEVADVSAYVATLAAAGESGEPTDTAAPEAVEPGSVAAGRDLFEGATRFENGGGACAACHTAGDVGNLGGGGLGPDLTDSHELLGGEVGLAAWLKTPPAPTMAPIFADRPLTDEEIADVVAFLGDTPTQEKAETSPDWLEIAGLVGVVILIGGMALAWRGMRQTYVERLRSNR